MSDKKPSKDDTDLVAAALGLKSSAWAQAVVHLTEPEFNFAINGIKPSEQAVLDFLKDSPRTGFEICDQFNLHVSDMAKMMKSLKRRGLVWERKTRTLGNRSVSRWGLKDAESNR